MTSDSDFDLEQGEQFKAEGMDRAAAKRAEMLALARELAVALAKTKGTVTADDVQEHLIMGGYKPSDLGNAAGSIFRGDRWEMVGWQKSRRASNHAHVYRVWRLTK